MRVKVDQQRIVQEIIDQGLSYSEIDRKANASPTWAAQLMRRIKSGKNPEAATVKRLADALGVKPDELIKKAA
jgi:transcriptional regulator with XRE-family HTH domain